MQLAYIRFLFGFDRWATRRVLAVLVSADDVDEQTWSTPNAIGDRGLGGILVHQLGAHQRWRQGLSGRDESPRPEREPLPTPAGLAAAWETEWVELDAWLDSLDDAALEVTDEGEGFDPKSVPDCTLAERLDCPSGRGVMLMRSFMTRIEYNAKGNSVVLEKKRAPAED